MNSWMKETLENEYNLVKIMKDTENTQISLLRHKKLGRNIILRKFTGNAGVYQILMSLSHANLPQVFEVVSEKPKTVVLEEYIDGITVADVLDTELYNENGVKAIVSDLCNALHILHTNGIIHRNIKPENIMVDTNGTVKLIDFGAARLYKFNRSEDTKIIGTTGYAAPEQFGFNQTDHKSDIFAIGVLMNVMLTNQHPSKQLYKGKLSKVIQRCIQVDPAKRYKSVLELKNNL